MSISRTHHLPGVHVPVAAALAGLTPCSFSTSIANAPCSLVVPAEFTHHVDFASLRALTIRGGSLGVRGLLSAGDSQEGSSAVVEPAERAIPRACESLRHHGVRRAHAIFNKSDQAARQIFTSAGFLPCEGESFFELQLRGSRGVNAPLPVEGYELRGASEADVYRLESIISDVPELAILDWEWALVRQGLSNLTRQALVVEHEGELVGALIGGHACGHATISHLWVDPNHRHMGLGRALSQHALARFHVADVDTVHVMTTAGNELANRFWSSLGFNADGARTFLEKDI